VFAHLAHSSLFKDWRIASLSLFPERGASNLSATFENALWYWRAQKRAIAEILFLVFAMSSSGERGGALLELLLPGSVIQSQVIENQRYKLIRDRTINRSKP
jgi:hypothetical protein